MHWNLPRPGRFRTFWVMYHIPTSIFYFSPPHSSFFCSQHSRSSFNMFWNTYWSVKSLYGLRGPPKLAGHNTFTSYFSMVLRRASSSSLDPILGLLNATLKTTSEWSEPLDSFCITPSHSSTSAGLPAILCIFRKIDVHTRFIHRSKDSWPPKSSIWCMDGHRVPASDRHYFWACPWCGTSEVNLYLLLSVKR